MRTDFLLAVIYGSPRRHSHSSKTFKKGLEQMKYIFIIILGPDKRMNQVGLVHSNNEPARPGLTATFFDGLYFRKV